MSDFDFERQLDITKSKVFLDSSSAFLGPLMCSVKIVWDESISTAATDGVTLWWNPQFFQKLSPETRITVLKHEIWHPGRLHGLRRGNRDKEIWNYACDIRINNDLKRDGESFVGIEWAWMDPEIDQGPDGILAEEAIYDILMKQGRKPPPQPGGQGDLIESEEDEGVQQEAIMNVIQAMHSAKAAGKAGAIPGVTSLTIEKFLESVVPWEVLLMKFFTDMLDTRYSWSRPNRRYSDMYMPCQVDDDGRLEHLIYYVDVSGSVSDRDILRCNSEVKYIKEELKPKKLTLVLFDTCIQQEYVFLEDDPFEKLVVTGRGGTSFVPVRQHIMDNAPSAVVVFSDMDCAPMAPLDFEVPVIWIGVNARKRTVPFGTIIHIRN